MNRPDAPRAGAPGLDAVASGKVLETLHKLGIHDLPSMLRTPPRRYVTPGPLRSLHEIAEGEEITIAVTVVKVSTRRMKNRRGGTLMEVEVTDGTDSLILPFFLFRPHLVDWHRGRLLPGRSIMVFGTVSVRRAGGRTQIQIAHPEYELYSHVPGEIEEHMRPRPVYALRRGVKQPEMRRAYSEALLHARKLPTALPSAVRARRDLGPLSRALHDVHAPAEVSDIGRGLRHLAYEEAFVLQAIFAQRRQRDARADAPALDTADGPLQQGLAARLPFALTEGQRCAIQSLQRSLSAPHPSSTLLQGDVGSGKTVVALHAMLRAVDSGHQAVLLAPTDVLARQHHATITALMGDLAAAGTLGAPEHATAVSLLTGSLSTAERRRSLLDITTGEAGLVIGTHAVLEDAVQFFSLGLTVIDEQHRFGVDHRRRLRAKGPDGTEPHTLVMSATPIPRTAALATAGDLDLLNLTEVPAHRSGLTSHAVPEQLPDWEQRMWGRTAEEIAAGRQAFVVCSRIELTDDVEQWSSSRSHFTDAGEHDAFAALIDQEFTPETPRDVQEVGEPDPRAVSDVAAKLTERPELAGRSIAVLHGRMNAEEKASVMESMNRGEIDVLVSTTVIEVGIDIPNASVMIVLDAERFGVSQLHQLRGRVGRGEHPGIAFFASRARPDGPALAHLRRVAETTDGFALAEMDLAQRGFGDLVGDDQSGLHHSLRHLDVVRHAELISTAREDAFALLETDPDLTEHPALAAAIADRLRDADPDVERS